MIKLKDYMKDGANYQAKAVLAFLQAGFYIEDSWCKERKEYKARAEVARWENCREQGYVVSMRSEDYSRQLNIAFFEHRNYDNICAVKWEQCSMKSLTIDTANFGDVYQTKWDTSHSVGYGNIVKMSDWIVEQFRDFWSEMND